MPGSIASRFLIASVTVIALFAGCDNSFTPKAEFHEQLVVYCVLDPTASMQVVRVEKTYDAEIGKPYPPEEARRIDSAKVFLSGDGKTVQCYDTLLTGSDGLVRRVWITRSLEVKEDGKYLLRVNVPGFEQVSSVLTVPSRLWVYAMNQRIDTLKAVIVKPGVPTMKNKPVGYYYRLFITCLKNIDGQWREIRREVPVFSDSTRNIYEFPSLGPESSMLYTFDALQRTHNQLLDGDTTVRDKQVLAVGYAFEKNFYNYYKVVRGFDDPASVRLDNPNVSFIDGGLGVFGGFSADSSRIWYNKFIGEAK